MKFNFEKFTCDVDVFRNGDDLIARFYDKNTEQDSHEIVDLVIVDPGFGYISLKFKGDDALLGGLLYKHVFSSEAMVCAAIEFIESLSPKANGAYIPHHIDLVSRVNYIEYNGEY